MNLVKAIHLRVPDADARTEVKTAEKRAGEDIKERSDQGWTF